VADTAHVRSPTRLSEHASGARHLTRETSGSSYSFAGVAPYRALRVWAIVTGLVVATVGVTVMLGWYLDVASLTRTGLGVSAMTFNTAVCLTLLGVGLAAGARTRAALAACAIAGAVGTVTLLEYSTGWNLGIDDAVFRDAASGVTDPGRMAVVTAVCLCLGAFALFALRHGRRALATGSAVVILAVGWLGSLGALFGVRALYDFGQFSTMSAHTAAVMSILGVSLLATVPDGVLAWLIRGDDPGATVVRRILPLALVGVPVVAQLTLFGEHAGWYQTEAGLAFMVIVASSGVSVVAVQMSRVINRSHAERVLVNEQLRDLNSSLEARIAERTADLVTSEAWARVLAWSAPVGIYHTDAHGQCTYVNDRWCDIYDMTVDAAYGDGWADRLHVEDREWVVAAWTRSIDATFEFDAEFRVVRRDGEVSWVHSHSARVLDGADSGGGYVGTVIDITARRQAEHALRETEELFRIAFGSSPIGMALVDSNGLIVRANRALCDLTCRELDELHTMRFQALLHPDNIGTPDRGASAADVDQRIVRADGAVCWASIRYAQIGERGAGNNGLTIVQFVDTTDRRRSEERLAHMANHDSLTGLINRRSLGEALERHVAHCNRYGPTGAVLILDLDNFKLINDSRGHSVGDRVIVTAAHLLRERLRESDLLARFGGDEFAVLLTDGDADAARAVAQSLVEEIRACSSTIDGGHIPLSVSLGVAIFDDVERSPDEMLMNADIAMYQAKELGRDRWAEFATERHDEPRAKARLTWINRIEADIDNDTFVLHAQPIVDLETGDIVQQELLIRMIGDHGDLVPPDSFSYIAERYGLSNRMDAWVLSQAFDLLEVTAEDLAPVTLAVNVSGTGVGDSQLRAVIETYVCSGRFDPARLVLHVSESSALSNIAAVRAFAARFHDLGCRLALSDVGGGFGSLYYVEHLPFDFIKLNGELITDCLEDSTNRAIIGDLVDLARRVGRQTIAPNVDSDGVRHFLSERGVDHGQGFHLGLPVPLEVAVPTCKPRADRPEPMEELTNARS
jgi:diguanylate cyclase (GGDEF)-like protein/PAS domain S-box-containing protein